MTAARDLRDVLQGELGKEIAVGRELARGHTFVVFEGAERGGRTVAIKVMPPAFAAASPNRAARVLRAARLAATIRHPRVLPVLRVAAGDRLAWFVTPRAAGSLAQLLEQECELSAARATALAGEIADALAAAHERRLPHGDLTPAVVMLDEQGGVKVRDFGIAPASEIRGAAPPPYDVHYLSPERVQGAAPSPASDQYALGVVAFQMLAGARPFFGETDDLVRQRHLELPVPDLRAARSDVPPAIAAAVERALAKRPDERFPSVTAFAAALRGEAAPAPGRIPLIRDQKSRTQQRDARDTRPARVPARPAARDVARGAVSPPPPAPALPLPRELVRPRLDPGRRQPPARSGGMPPAAAFAVVALGLGGLWLYVARTGPSDHIASVEPLAAAETALTQERSYGGALPPPDPSPVPGAGLDTAADTTAAPAAPAARSAPPPRRPQRTVSAAKPAAARNQPPKTAPAVTAGTPAPLAEQPTVGWLTVGSVPQGAIFVNGRLMPNNPVVAAAVDAGPVRLRFEATASDGRTLEREMTINLGPGDSLNLGRVRLDRP